MCCLFMLQDVLDQAGRAGVCESIGFCLEEMGLRQAYLKYFVEDPISYVRMSEIFQKYIFREMLKEFLEF